METIIGTCSRCGGPVSMPGFMVNPVPYCKRCGAIARQPHGPIIPMVSSEQKAPVGTASLPADYWGLAGVSSAPTKEE